MSSDSSDNEDLDKLREATDSQFINDGMFHKKESKNCERQKSEKPPSLRWSKDEDEQFNLFRVSPEFRGYVAKHLSVILDNMLNKKVCQQTDYNNHNKPKRRKTGIKLFKNSSHFVKVVPVASNQSTQKITKKYPNEREIDDKELRSVAVNPEDILNQKGTEHWSRRSKAPVYTYIQTEEGLILK